MSFLRPFREVPKDLREWSRWAVAQDRIKVGSGSPEGAVKGNPGNLYLNTDGGSSTTLYVKESGDGTNTGWVAK